MLELSLAQIDAHHVVGNDQNKDRLDAIEPDSVIVLLQNAQEGGADRTALNTTPCVRVIPNASQSGKAAKTTETKRPPWRS